MESPFSWAVDGYGKQFVCWRDSNISRYVLFSPLSNIYLGECIELLEQQYFPAEQLLPKPGQQELFAA
ncbi:hypothetical protein [Pseudomonas sp.]|uniref:hypothetical protein n=1 Tax=Pseudomonas sp. TaxID=306 RepID=UPI00260814DC|nr:hypothetical protein [Pseudomonas sp.]